MKIFGTFKSATPTQMGRFALLAALAAAITALLALAAPAGAELTDGAAGAPIAAAESAAAEGPAPVSLPPAESLPPVEQTETPATEPVETEEVTSANSATTTVDDDVVAPAPSDLPASTKPIDNAVPSRAAAVGSIPAAVSEVVVLAKTGPDTTVVSSPQQRISGLAESIHRDSAKTIESIRKGSAETIAPVADRLAPVTDRLPAIRTLPAAELLDSIAPATAATLLPTAGAMPETARKAESGGAFSSPEPPLAGLFSHGSAIASDASMWEYLVAGRVGTVGLGAASDRASGPLSASMGIPGSSPTGIPFDNRFGSPAPVNIPLPAPGSPATTVSGSGGSSFVPLVALLALLALVAPATLRRLWEAADFRAPTPFVCALERPG